MAGEPLPPALRAESPLTHVFPTPERLAAASLATLGVPRARARALSALATEVVGDTTVLSAGQELHEAVRRLRLLPGVGEWTAQYIAMRELREPDAFPVADAALLRAASRIAGRAVTTGELLRRAEAWRPFRAYAAIHLWASLAETAPHRQPLLPEPAHALHVA
jgi:AraC family transcriptional regulator of adaptative response / DNA-3-methyladenine glycosylase II